MSRRGRRNPPPRRAPYSPVHPDHAGIVAEPARGLARRAAVQPVHVDWLLELVDAEAAEINEATRDQEPIEYDMAAVSVLHWLFDTARETIEGEP